MKSAKEIVTISPPSCGKNETVQSAVDQMSEFNIGFLPVVNENKKIIGTITDRDICLAVGRNKKPMHDLRVYEIMNYSYCSQN